MNRFRYKGSDVFALLTAFSFLTVGVSIGQVYQNACRLVPDDNSWVEEYQWCDGEEENFCDSYDAKRIQDDGCNPSANGTILTCDLCPEQAGGHDKKRKYEVRTGGYCEDHVCTGGIWDHDVEYVRQVNCGESCVAGV